MSCQRRYFFEEGGFGRGHGWAIGTICPRTEVGSHENSDHAREMRRAERMHVVGKKTWRPIA